MNFLPEAQYLMLQKVRQYQKTEEFQQRYATRAGVEGCLSQGVRAFGLRRSRYTGLAKTHLQHVITAVAMNLARLWNWWQEIPKALKHGSWLNMAEIELSILSRQCLDRRADFASLEGEVAAWQKHREQKQTWIDW